MARDLDSKQRRRLLSAATCSVAAGGVAGAAGLFVAVMNPSAKTKATVQPVKVDVAKLAPGQMLVVNWRSIPVYVVKRTAAQLASLSSPGGELIDPDSQNADQPAYIRGADRSLRPDVLVVAGVCTHFNCAPKYRPDPDAKASWQGGFVCPCHGSLFDMAGRVFKGGPASDNLAVPPYFYESADVLVIGASAEDVV
ncbi:MAG: ubiquinol-cytochrome c reductase iron-sulfur subunit [Gammaproteobacteria bacterium]|nr:MAG: ubiquinol-cytochrome c reductase iron-sulfur subunit [Gammaproteobacteria bacterium]